MAAPLTPALITTMVTTTAAEKAAIGQNSCAQCGWRSSTICSLSFSSFFENGTATSVRRCAVAAAVGRSRPPELEQPLVADAEVMGQLVHDGDLDTAHQLLLGAGAGRDGPSEDRDAVGHRGSDAVPHRSLGERNPFVEAVERTRRRVVVDVHADVADHPP